MRRMLDQLRPCSAAVHITMYQRRQAQALRPSMRASLQAPVGRCRVTCSPAHEACRRSAAAPARHSAHGHLVPGRQVQQLQNEGAPCAAGRLDCGQCLRARSSTAPECDARTPRDDCARYGVCAGPHREAVERDAHTAGAALLRPPHSLAHAGQGILQSTCAALTGRPRACRAVRAQSRRAGPHRAARARPTARRSPGTLCVRGRRPSASCLHRPATCHGPCEQQAGRLPRPAWNQRLRAPACAGQLGGGRRSLVQQPEPPVGRTVRPEQGLLLLLL